MCILYSTLFAKLPSFEFSTQLLNFKPNQVNEDILTSVILAESMGSATVIDTMISIIIKNVFQQLSLNHSEL